MKKYSFALLFLFSFSVVFSQSKQLWKGYFSYNDIKDLSESPSKIYAASENALFTKEKNTGELRTYNTIDGLSGQTISAMYHSEATKKTLFGYDNGLLLVRNEIDGSILNVVDIISKNIPQNIKKVNHFMEYEGIVYVSCDFGIVQYNLNTLQFGDTYFIGDNGTQIIVNQTAVFEGKIYAATQNYGIRNASISNPNLNDYNQWTTMVGNGWKGIATYDDKLVAITTNGNIQKLQSGTFVNQTVISQNPVDFRANQNHLVVTTQNHVYVYNTSFSQIADINSSQVNSETATTFSCATVIDNTLYIGTLENGVYSNNLDNALNFENILPDGPFKNLIFNVKKSNSNLWAVYGGYDRSYNPYAFFGGITQYGISSYSNQNGWSLIPYSDLLGAKSLSQIAINPFNENEVYVTSFFSGLLKINESQITLYDDENTGSNGLFSLTNVTNENVRVNAPIIDKNNNLWVANCRIEKPLKVLKPNNTWQSYALPLPVNNDYAAILIDKNETKWIATFRNGLYAFNENYNNKSIVVKDVSTSQHPDLSYIKTIAIDNRNQIWIGTARGLRVLNSVDAFLSNDELESDAIIILEDGLAQELLFEQFIMDIVVDGANNKWIATNTSGVFKFSSDGQKELLHFTTTNSPLPSNNVLDIEIDSLTGEVFLATDKGMVSYKGTATSANENLENVFIYPNPVRPEFGGTVKISGLLDKATVKITDIGGNLVYETTSEGGTIEWDTTAFGKYKVASGVYMVFISAEDGVETKVKKVMIIR